MKETVPSEVVEHDLAERYVNAGQPLELYRRQRHTGHLEVFSPNPFERQAVGQHIHTISLSCRGGRRAATRLSSQRMALR